MYGGKFDEDLNKAHVNTAGTQKFVNLFDDLLAAFRHKGHCVTMDSAYMGDIMAQIMRKIWGINALGTAQANRVGADVSEAKAELTVGTYESRVFQHILKPLVYALWSDNNIVKTLSNFHSPKLLKAGQGVLRKKKGADGKREQHKTAVTCPDQSKDYTLTFHLIDRGNGTEASYDLGGKSRLHNWTPKLVFRLFNMAFNNARLVYLALSAKHSPGVRTLPMPKCINELAHDLMQSGPAMRRRAAEHPLPSRDLTCAFDTGCGRAV